jgi:glutathione synthase/RimK-type ligase-like ATP-grasp enzyme
MFSKKYYIGTICNRDLEIFEEITSYLKDHYDVKIINLIPHKGNKKGRFNVEYFCKKIKKHPISLIILKLFSEESNQIIYKTLKTYAPQIPLLNNIDSVRICESRKESFKFVEKEYKKLKVAKSYYSFQDALRAASNRTELIIKFDVHNAPYISKEDRIIGIAKNSEELFKITDGLEKNNLFFQEYLGNHNIIYKAYVIDRWIACITTHDRLIHNQSLPLELVHIRIPINSELKRKIIKLGRKFGMAIFGVDYIIAVDGQPYIIDINDFPSFRNIPEAIALISEYIYEFLMFRQKIEGNIQMRLKARTSIQ